MDLLQNRSAALLTELDNTWGVKLLLFRLMLHIIELSDQGQHLVCPAWIAVLGIKEFPPGMGPATHLRAIAFGEQLVIALIS